MADDAQNIYDLDPALPLANASAGEGDDEIRQFKFAVRNSIAGNAGNVDWEADFPNGGYDNTQPDYFNDVNLGGKMVVGPRFLNMLPDTVDKIIAAGITTDSRLDDLETDVAALTPASMPIGAIIMWAGTTPPTGWRICDGTNGTPNLSSRFIVGAGGFYTVGATGGGATATSTDGAHVHTNVTVGSHALTGNELPPHGHPWQHVTQNANSVEGSANGGIVTGPGTAVTVPQFPSTPDGTSGQQIGGYGLGQGHTHANSSAANTGSVHSHVVDVRPLYYCLAFIQYKGV